MDEPLDPTLEGDPHADPNAEPGAEPEGRDQAPATVPKAEFDKLSRRVETLSEKMQSDREELEATALYWKERADRAGQGGGDDEGADPPPADDPGDADVDGFLDDINRRGPKALDAYLEKRGLISRADAERLIQERTERLLETAGDTGRLVSDYPDLADRNSDFFKAVLKEAKEQGLPEDHPRRTRLAAQAVELRLRREGKWEEPGAEDERRHRARAAGAPGADPGGEETASDELTADQERLAIQITGLPRAEAIKAYRARAKKGVNVSARGSLAHHLAER